MAYIDVRIENTNHFLELAKSIKADYIFVEIIEIKSLNDDICNVGMTFLSNKLENDNNIFLVASHKLEKDGNEIEVLDKIRNMVHAFDDEVKIIPGTVRIKED